jgi:hypothetical protein
MMINVVHLGFFYLLADLSMKDTHQVFKHPCVASFFVVPIDRRVGGKIFGQVFPIAPFFHDLEK